MGPSPLFSQLLHAESLMLLEAHLLPFPHPTLPPESSWKEGEALALAHADALPGLRIAGLLQVDMVLP